MTQKREKELDEIDDQMENFLDETPPATLIEMNEDLEDKDDEFILEKSKTHQEVIKASQ